MSTQNINYTREDILVCASHGNIYAIHKSNGSKIWKTSAVVMGGIISLFVTDNDKVMVGAYGKTMCLNLINGKLLWENDMPGFGHEEISIITTPSHLLRPNAQLFHSLEEKYKSNNIPDKPIVIAGSKGHAMGIDSETGKTLWVYNCPGGRYNIPVVIVEPPNMAGGRPDQLVYIGAAKMVYCLKARTGAVVWTSQVTSSLFGSNFMTLATPWSSRLSAETHSAFNQNPSAQYLELQRERNRKKKQNV